MSVVKRDNSVEPFSPDAINNAIISAMEDTGVIDHPLADKITEELTNKYENAFQTPISEIHSAIERKLMGSSRKDVARAYIEFRSDRDRAREVKSDLVNNIQGLMGGTDSDVMDENANKDARTIPTKRDLLAGILSKHYALNYILPRDVADAHISGSIHYHDLDYSPFGSYFNCCHPNIKYMFSRGFKLGNADIESPKSITTAAAVLCQIVAVIASNTYGGTTLGWIDEVLAPYVELSYQKHLQVAYEWDIVDAEGFAESRTDKEVHDAMQAIEYECNSLFTANGQTPFVSIHFGLGTSRWARLIQRKILEIRIEGLGKNKLTAIFPKLIMTIRDGVNHKPDDTNYDIKQLALECSSKRIYPDIINYDQLVEVTGGHTPPMGCRSFLHPMEEGQGDHMDHYLGRMNMGVVSLNLPSIALESGGDFTKFDEILAARLLLCRKALMTRISRLSTVKAHEAPLIYMEGAMGLHLDPEELVLPYLKEKASISLGYIGINEMVNAMYPEGRIYTDEDQYTFGLRIIKVLHDACAEWKVSTGYNFSVYSTPSENLCKRFQDINRKDFGVIEGVTDSEWMTNSFHLEVSVNVTPYDKIDFERPFIQYANAGFISYGELPSMRNNLKGLEDVWDYSYYNTPYYGTNTPVDQCFECGFNGEFNATSRGYECPACGNRGPNKNIIRRLCGYLGSPDDRPFNSAKQSEIENRVKHL